MLRCRLSLRPAPLRVVELAVLLTLLLTLVSPAWARSTLRFEVRPEPAARAASVVVRDGAAVIRVRGDSVTAATRTAQIIAERLNALADAGTAPAAFGRRTVAEGQQLVAGNAGICTVDRPTAQRAGLDVPALADSWLTNLRQAFRGPYLAVPFEALRVPLAEPFKLPINGVYDPAGLTAGITGPGLSVIKDGRSVSLTGTQLGDGTLRLSVGGATLELPVQVLQRAGTVRQPVVARVTGQAPPAALARHAVWSALYAAAQQEPGAIMRFNLPSRWSLPTAGGATTVAAEVNIDGPGLLPFRDTVPVRVQVEPWPDVPASRLLVSNDPESVRGTGLLLRGRLDRGQRTRLLYHHKTVAGGPLIYELRLLNPTREPVAIHVQNALSGPNRDEIYVGHQAAVGYWRQRMAGQGAIVLIPPGMSWTVASVATPHDHVLSGLAEFTPLAGDGFGPQPPVELQVVATSGSEVEGPRAILGNTPAAFDDHYHFFEPQQLVRDSYQPGSRYAFIEIGRVPIASVQGRTLAGNYGVVYAIDLTYENTTPEPARFELTFSADGGVARGVLLINGELIETGLVRPTEQERLLDFTLAPGARREFRIFTLPQSGSNYPLRLVGRPYQYGWPGRGPGV